MKKMLSLLISSLMVLFLVGCKGNSIEKKSLIGKDFNLEVTNTTKVYEESINYDTGDNIEFDMIVKEGTASIGLYAEDNTEVYSGNLSKGEMEFVVNIIEKGTYKLKIDLNKVTGEFEIELKD